VSTRRLLRFSGKKDAYPAALGAGSAVLEGAAVRSGKVEPSDEVPECRGDKHPMEDTVRVKCFFYGELQVAPLQHNEFRKASSQSRNGKVARAKGRGAGSAWRPLEKYNLVLHANDGSDTASTFSKLMKSLKSLKKLSCFVSWSPFFPVTQSQIATGPIQSAYFCEPDGVDKRSLFS
jgi:hypothetical protein